MTDICKKLDYYRGFQLPNIVAREAIAEIVQLRADLLFARQDCHELRILDGLMRRMIAGKDDVDMQIDDDGGWVFDNYVQLTDEERDAVEAAARD